MFFNTSLGNESINLKQKQFQISKSCINIKQKQFRITKSTFLLPQLLLPFPFPGGTTMLHLLRDAICTISGALKVYAEAPSAERSGVLRSSLQTNLFEKNEKKCQVLSPGPVVAQWCRRWISDRKVPGHQNIHQVHSEKVVVKIPKVL